MLGHEMKHVIRPLGDGCSIGVIDRFVDLLPPYTHEQPLTYEEPRTAALYEVMTVAFGLDEE